MKICNFLMYFAPIVLYPAHTPNRYPSREFPKGDLGPPGGISLRNDHRTTDKSLKMLTNFFPGSPEFR